MKRILVALGFGCASLVADPVFDFSWTSVGQADYNLTGNPVTIAGQIFGLPDNGASPATDIVVDSITGATPDPGTIFTQLPVDLMSSTCQTPTNFAPFDQNTFVVQNDVITSASFFCQTNDVLEGTFGLGTGTTWVEYLSGGVLRNAPPDFVLFAPNLGGIGYMGTATYSVAPVPEPSPLAVAAVAMLLAMGAVRRYRKSETSMRSMPSSSTCVK
jgi:hypothetical protein